MKKPKVVIYDNDGMITDGARFSDTYSKEFNIPMELMDGFFDVHFKNCLHGKADLKEELRPFLEKWKWNGTVDELLDYWFRVGAEPNHDTYESISKLKEQGVVCCLATNQEKYRTQFLIQKMNYNELFDEIFSSADLCVFKTSEEGLGKIFNALKERYGDLEKDEILYWDDREGNVKHLNEFGFNGQKYKDYNSFKQTMNDYGFEV
jgi:putative hydrolase of the HAD superfamily